MLDFVWTDDLNSDVYKSCLDLRVSVFVKEKGSPIEMEIMNEDKCDFVAVYMDGELIGTGRIFHESEGDVLFQRIAVKKEYRSRGYGAKMIEEMEIKSKSLGVEKINICASMHAFNFYTRLGYEAYGEEFERGEIKHIMMKKDL